MFVSQERYDLAVAQAERSMNLYQKAMEDMREYREREKHLTDKLLELTEKYGALAQQVQKGVDPKWFSAKQDGMPSEVQEAIDYMSRGNRTLAGELTTWANRALEKPDADPSEVARVIYDGEGSDEEVFVG